MSKNWIITGANRGFGREFALAALSRGDRVAATSRKPEALDDLVDRYGERVLPLALDVTDRAAAFAAVEQAAAHFGRLDVVVNNAGYGLFGMVEELTEQQLRDQLEVNLFGAFHITQAALPILRRQGSGHIVQISTIGGVLAFPELGGYHASKWALEGMTDSLAQEVGQFGIKVTLVEPGPFGTDWGGSSAVHAEALPEYADFRTKRAEQMKQRGISQGDPKAAGPALLKIVDAQEPPLRAFFGSLPTQMVPPLYQQKLNTWQKWEPLAHEANGNAAAGVS